MPRKRRTKEERLAYQRKWRKEHAAQHLALTNRWREENRDYVNAYRRESTRKNPEKTLWYAAKKRAAKANIPFDIEISDVVIPPFCPVLGIPLHRSKGQLDDHSPSIDKFKPELGYVKGNVTIVSMRANRIKADATISEIQLLLDWMVSHDRS